MAEQVHDHNIVFSLASAIVYSRDAVVGGCVIAWDTVDNFSLIEELWAFLTYCLKFDGDLGLVFIVEGHEDLTKSARAKFFDKFVVFSDGGVHHFGNFVFLSIFIRRKQIIKLNFWNRDILFFVLLIQHGMLKTAFNLNFPSCYKLNFIWQF